MNNEKMKFTKESIKNGYDNDIKSVRSLLTDGIIKLETEYLLYNKEVSNWHTEIILKGLESYSFNSVVLEDC